MVVEDMHVRAQSFVEHYRLGEVRTHPSTYDYSLCGRIDDHLAARAVELIAMRSTTTTARDLKCKMFYALHEKMEGLRCTGHLESDTSLIFAEVNKCVDDGATPIACMTLVLSVMTGGEAVWMGW